MSIVKKVVLALLAIIVLFVVVGFLLPSRAHVERSITIEAPQATVFALVDGYRRFNDWSPWHGRDPETRYELEGPEFGVGAKMRWASDQPDVGSGSIETTASEPYSLVRSRLDFGPRGTAESFIRLEPAAAGTAVTWGFETGFGANLPGRYMGLMFNRWVGADYEAGLANLKELAESLPSTDWSDLEIGLIEAEPATIAFATGSSSWDVEAIGQTLAACYGQVAGFLRRHRLEQTGPPVAITRSHDDSQWQFDAGLPIAAAPDKAIPASSPVQVRQTYGGPALCGRHVGPYAGISAAWDKISAYAAAYGYRQAGMPWEEYVSDPGDTPESELITRLCLPVVS